jgi:excisionase family DNA binding protein
MIPDTLADDAVGIPSQSSKPTSAPMLLSVKGCAALLNVGVSTLWLMISTGELPSIKVRGRRLIKRVDLERLASQGTK